MDVCYIKYFYVVVTNSCGPSLTYRLYQDDFLFLFLDIGTENKE